MRHSLIGTVHHIQLYRYLRSVPGGYRLTCHGFRTAWALPQADQDRFHHRQQEVRERLEEPRSDHQCESYFTRSG